MDLFRAAAHQVVQRHPILLASLSEDGEWQRLNPDAKLDMPLFDLSREDETERERKLAEIIDRETSEAFDLVAGPLLRVRIVRMSPEHHVVIWTAHHVVCDGWSGGLIISELAKIYSALKQGKQPDLEEPVPFREYALASRKWDRKSSESVTYWCEQFATLPPPLELPTDRPRRPVRTARASTVKRNLGHIAATIDQASRRATPHDSGRLVDGSSQDPAAPPDRPVGPRRRPRSRRAGHNRQELSGGPLSESSSDSHAAWMRTTSFQGNLMAVKKSVLDAYDHHQVTVGGILRHLKVPRSTSRPPLIEVIFNVDRDPGAAEFHGGEVRV